MNSLAVKCADFRRCSGQYDANGQFDACLSLYHWAFYENKNTCNVLVEKSEVKKQL
jgi:hypothetical protein